MQKNCKHTPRTVAHSLSLTLAVLLFAFSFLTPLYQAEAAERVFSTSELPRLVIPGGDVFGVKMETDGVIAVGFQKSQNAPSPAEKGGIKRGDILTEIDHVPIENASDFLERIETSGGRPLAVTVVRNGKTAVKTLTAEQDTSGRYRVGLSVRDATAGIGTVTAILPDGSAFFGLGHGICDSDTGILMPLKSGEVFDIAVSRIDKGREGAPGEIKGVFAASPCGKLTRNTLQGISGSLSGKCFDDRQPVAPAERSEVKLGRATVICTLDDNIRCEYEVSLIKITDPVGREKNFVIEVTDKALLEKTGGIVQGMSGSPIMQNGKLIGAVTHVMVNEPTRGYGIFIDSMLASLSQ